MKVVVISGPTATGKTSLAVELATRFNGEIVNFDSLLLYREISIGTAKPTPEEKKAIKHHLIDVRSITDPMTAADYSKEAFLVTQDLLATKKNVFLVGGSGFYLQALLKGMYDSPSSSAQITKRSDLLYQTDGIAPFVNILTAQDPLSLERYHLNDHYRIRRAVEYLWNTGTPMSQARQNKDSSNSSLGGPSIHDWELLHIHLDLPKDQHLKIIESRTEMMFENGLLLEVEGLLRSGFNGNEKPLQSIGYREVFDFKSGKIRSLEECKDRIVISTRQLAKSQRTWFKRDEKKVNFNPVEQRTEIFALLENFLT